MKPGEARGADEASADMAAEERRGALPDPRVRRDNAPHGAVRREDGSAIAGSDYHAGEERGRPNDYHPDDASDASPDRD